MVGEVGSAGVDVEAVRVMCHHQGTSGHFSFPFLTRSLSLSDRH